MTTVGPNSGGTFADDAAVGTVSWLNPGNAASSNDVRATCALIISAQSHYLKATNFGFAIPVDATISGVTVEIERGHNIAVAGTADDTVVSLVKGGVVSGDNKADLLSDWPSLDTYNVYGGSADLWGLALSPADINASDFGMVVSANEVGDGAITIRVDHIRITVDYTGGTPVSPNSNQWPSMGMMGFGS